MKRTRISVLLVIALLLQLYAPLTAGAADFTPNPQTEYAKRFIAACDGQTWFINEIERLLNVQQRTLDTITGAEDLVEIKKHWSERAKYHRTYPGCNRGTEWIAVSVPLG